MESKTAEPTDADRAFKDKLTAFLAENNIHQFILHGVSQTADEMNLDSEEPIRTTHIQNCKGIVTVHCAKTILEDLSSAARFAIMMESSMSHLGSLLGK